MCLLRSYLGSTQRVFWIPRRHYIRMLQVWRKQGEQMNYVEQQRAQIVNRKIVDFYVGDDRIPVIMLDDGTALAIMRDDEGNGPGALWIMEPENG